MGNGAHKSSSILCLRMLATAHECVEVRGPVAGTGSLLPPYGSQRSNSGSQVLQQVHFYPLNHLASPTGLVFFFFYTNNSYYLNETENSDTTSKLPTERLHPRPVSGRLPSCLPVQDPISRMPSFEDWASWTQLKLHSVQPKSWDHSFLWTKGANSQLGELRLQG